MNDQGVSESSQQRPQEQTRTLTLPQQPFPLVNGESLPRVDVVYQTWGELNDDKSNAILLSHALSGSHHACGYNPSIPQAGELWRQEMHRLTFLLF